MWLTNEDITGYDIPGAGTDGNSGLAVSNNACMLRCQNTAGCNAVVFKKYSKQCWMKKAPDEGLRLEPVANDESDSILLCPSQTFSAMAPETQSDTAGEPETTSDTAVERSSDGSTRESIGKQSKGVMSAGVMAGIIVAVLLGLICSAVIVVWVLVRQRAESKRTGANQVIEPSPVALSALREFFSATSTFETILKITRFGPRARSKDRQGVSDLHACDQDTW